ncbi:MAG: LysR family transcriptional regulator [Rhizobiaceae bacterium]|nr:LysR family transcriptional regulator [Rhizobiaceae bacterium]
MDLGQLRFFVCVAERLNLSHAADVLGVSQPALSSSMGRLQKELGARLYYRRGRGIALTESGHALLRHARSIEQHLHDALGEVEAISQGNLSHVRIGAGPAWLNHVLPSAMAAMIASHPRVRFTAEVGFPDQLIKRLRVGELDVVLAGFPESRLDPDLRFLSLASDRILVVGRAGHPLSKNPLRSIQDYARYQWVLPGPKVATRQRVEQVFAKNGLGPLNVVVESDSLSLMFSVLRQTDCLGMITSQTILLDEARPLVAIDHDEFSFSREAGFVSLRHAEMPPAVKNLLSELRKVMAAKDDRIGDSGDRLVISGAGYSMSPKVGTDFGTTTCVKTKN